MDIRDFFQLERSFQGDRITDAPCQVKKITSLIKAARHLLNSLILMQRLINGCRQMDQRFGGQRLHAAEQELDYWLRCQIGDPAGLWRPIRDALQTSPYQTLITGHSHLPGVVELPEGRTYANSGSWTFGSSQYLLLQDGKLESKDWISGKEYGDRLYQPLLSDAYEGMTFDSWWEQNYMGLLRYRAGEDRRRAAS